MLTVEDGEQAERKARMKDKSKVRGSRMANLSSSKRVWRCQESAAVALCPFSLNLSLFQLSVAHSSRINQKAKHAITRFPVSP